MRPAPRWLVPIAAAATALCLAVPGAHGPGASAERNPLREVTGAFTGIAARSPEPFDATGTIFPPDDRELVPDTSSAPYRAIVHLAISSGGVPLRQCTGAMVAPNAVLTAAHCVTGPRPFQWADAVVVSPGRRGDVRPFGSATAVSFSLAEGWLEGHPELDVAILHLSGDPFHGATAPAMTLGAMPTGYFAGRLLELAGYPSDRPAGTMWRTTFTDAAATNVRINTRADAAPGQSGSPVFERNGGEFLASAVYSIQTAGENVAVRITPSLLEALRGYCEGRCALTIGGGAPPPPPPWTAVTRVALVGIAADR